MESGFAEGYAVGKDSSNGGGYGFGGYGSEWIWIIVLFALWQNGGFGGGYGNRGGIGENYVLATDFATIERKLDGVNAGLCDGFYAMNTGMLNGFAGVQQSLTQGFSGVNASITDVGYAIKDCCCQTQRAIDGVNYNVATQFGTLNTTLCGLGRDIIENQNANYRALHDEIVANKIEAKNERIAELQAQVSGLQLKASQEAQNAYLLSELKPCGKPAYIVPNPNCCYQYNVAPVSNGGSCCF
jgi:hypothetical protein